MNDRTERNDDDAALRRRILELPLFAGLPPGARNAVDQFARLEAFPPGEAFIRQGEYTGDFYVVLSGIVSAYRVEPDGERILLDQLGPGEWFGELSALSNQPSPAKLQADTACIAVVLESGLFKELYKSGKKFKEAVDARYRERALAVHLRTVPLFKGLSNDLVRSLRQVVRFETFEQDHVIAREGEPAREIHLVRNGAVVMKRRSGDGERLQGYFMTNSSFGEHAFLAGDETWEGTYTTMMRSEVLVLEVDAMRAFLRDDVTAIAAIEGAARRIAAEEAGALETSESGENLDELEIMVNRQSAKGGEALVIDLEKCVRCNACVESCVAVHDDRVPRLSKKGNRVAAENNRLGKTISLVTSCYSCGTPGCMLACSYGAIRRDRSGLVRFVWDNCVGCAMCVQGCPYDVIRLTPPPEEATAAKSSRFADIPVIGGFLDTVFGAARASSGDRTEQRQGYHKDVAAKGKAIKCDRCEGLPFEACVYNCPTGAIGRMSPAQIFGRSTGPEAGR